MKILILSNIFPPGFIGGYELGAFDIARALAKEGNIVHVISSDYFNDPILDVDNLTIDRSFVCCSICHSPTDQSRSFVDLSYQHNIRVISSCIKWFKPELVLSFNLDGCGVLEIIQFIDKIKIPHIVYLMDNIFRSFRDENFDIDRFGRFELSSQTCFISMSKRLVREIEATICHRILNLKILPGWVESKFLRDKPLIVDRNYTNFVFSSRIAKHKGIDVVLDSASKLVKTGFDNFHIDIYGNGEIAELLYKINQNGLQRTIEFKGVLDKEAMIPALSQYDALLFPTWDREPFGFIAAEAAASGALPIITAGTGASEYFLHGVDSIKISRNSDDLSSAMLYVMLLPSCQRMQLRQNAINTAKRFFNFDTIFEKLKSIIFDHTKKTRRDIDLRKINQLEASFIVLSYLPK